MTVHDVVQRRLQPVSVERLRVMFDMQPDGTLFWKLPPKPHPTLTGKVAGSPMPNHSGKVYWAIQIDGKKYKRSQLVFCLTHGRWPTLQIDHINCDSTDDRPENLREATCLQNAQNTKRRPKANGMPQGVRRIRSGRFNARIRVNRNGINLGTFATVHEATDAYLSARRSHFGEFA